MFVCVCLYVLYMQYILLHNIIRYNIIRQERDQPGVQDRREQDGGAEYGCIQRYIHIYIYIYIERERDLYNHIYIYI